MLQNPTINNTEESPNETNFHHSFKPSKKDTFCDVVDCHVLKGFIHINGDVLHGHWSTYMGKLWDLPYDTTHVPALTTTSVNFH